MRYRYNAAFIMPFPYLIIDAQVPIEINNTLKAILIVFTHPCHRLDSKAVLRL